MQSPVFSKLPRNRAIINTKGKDIKVWLVVIIDCGCSVIARLLNVNKDMIQQDLQGKGKHTVNDRYF